MSNLTTKNNPAIAAS